MNSIFIIWIWLCVMIIRCELHPTCCCGVDVDHEHKIVESKPCNSIRKYPDLARPHLVIWDICYGMAMEI